MFLAENNGCRDVREMLVLEDAEETHGHDFIHNVVRSTERMRKDYNKCKMMDRGRKRTSEGPEYQQRAITLVIKV